MKLPKLTRKKIGDQQYDLVMPDGRVVGNAVKTGTHLDDYPWEWILADDLYAVLKEKGFGNIRSQGSEDTLTACVDQLASKIVQYDLIPNPKKGDQ